LPEAPPVALGTVGGVRAELDEDTSRSGGSAPASWPRRERSRSLHSSRCLAAPQRMGSRLPCAVERSASLRGAERERATRSRAVRPTTMPESTPSHPFAELSRCFSGARAAVRPRGSHP
jgi:hypothetical protein